MDWRKEAAEELREYEAKKTALHSLPEDIAQLKAGAYGLGGASNSVPVKGGGSTWEGKQIDRIVRHEKLETSLRHVTEWVEKVETGLAILDAEERLVLDRFFIHPAKGNVDRLCGELGLEKSAVYNRRDTALRKYTLARYGCTEV